MPDQKPNKRSKGASAANTPKVPVKKGEKQSGQQEGNAEYPAKDSPQSASKTSWNPYKWIVRYVKKRYNEKNIAFAGVVVNGLLVLITFIYMLITQKSVSIAEHSLKDVDSQFVVSHRPFLQISNIEVDSLEENQRSNVTFYINNGGSFPAKIIHISSVFAFGPVNADKKKVYEQMDTTRFKVEDSTQEIVISNLTARRVITLDSPISIEVSRNIKNGAFKFFLRTNIKYIDFINKQHYSLFEMIYIRPFPIKDIYTDSATEGTF